MANIIDVSHFNLKMIPPRSTILNYGKRGSGKTTLLCNQLEVVHVDYPLGCAIAPTAAVRLELCKHMPSSLIWPEFDIDKLTAVVSQFTESTMPDWMEYSNDKKSDKEAKADILNWLLIMDDCGFSEKTFRHVTFNNMYMNGRQVGQGIILNLQRLRSIGPQLRGQLDYVFLFRDLSKSVQESIHQDFFSFLDFKTFKALYLRCTEGYNCIVLDVQKAQRIRNLGYSSKSTAECIFVYSPKPIPQIPSYAMFHPYVWKLDIAWKRLLKKRALSRSLHQSTTKITTPRIAIAQEKRSPPPPIDENKVTNEKDKENEIKLPKTTHFAGYPISTFSSLRSIPTPLPKPKPKPKKLRPSATQLHNDENEKTQSSRKHAFNHYHHNEKRTPMQSL